MWLVQQKRDHSVDRLSHVRDATCSVQCTPTAQLDLEPPDRARHQPRIRDRRKVGIRRWSIRTVHPVSPHMPRRPAGHPTLRAGLLPGNGRPLPSRRREGPGPSSGGLPPCRGRRRHSHRMAPIGHNRHRNSDNHNLLARSRSAPEMAREYVILINRIIDDTVEAGSVTLARRDELRFADQFNNRHYLLNACQLSQRRRKCRILYVCALNGSGDLSQRTCPRFPQDIGCEGPSWTCNRAAPTCNELVAARF
jgi:hypothetical protein